MFNHLQLLELCLMDHVLFFLLAIVLPFLSVISSNELEESKLDVSTKISLYYNNGLFLTVVVSIILTSWFYLDRPFVSLGFSYPDISLSVIIISVLFIILYIVDLYYPFFHLRKGINKANQRKKKGEFLPDSWFEFKHYLFLAICAGICEEVLFRGFLIHYLFSVFGDALYSVLIAILLPAFLFAIGHIYQGKWAVVKVFIGAVLLGIIYTLSASLWIVIGIHIFVDIVSALFAFFMYKKTDIQQSEVLISLIEKENEK